MNQETQNKILYKALLSRAVEEKLLNLFNEGLLSGTVHTCIGQELSGAVISEFLIKNDTIFSNHRCHGHFLSITDDVNGLIAELMGKSSGVCGGRGGSQHLYKDGFFSSGIQGGFLPVSAGLALGHKFNQSKNIAVAFIGDGTLGEGAIYEAFNVASKWNLPLLVVLEDNGFSQSTAQEETLAGSITARAAAFDMMSENVDTWDWQTFHEKSGKFIAKVREESRPGLLVVKTFRLKAHSKGDDNRPAEFVKKYFDIDPLNLWIKANEAEHTKKMQDIDQRVNKAVELAKASPVGEVLHKKPKSKEVFTWKKNELSNRRTVKAINDHFTDLFKNDKKVIFIGEDIRSPYGGAFKITQGLSDIDTNRVFNTPISESCIVGMGTGLGMLGYKPMVEIMFGDFLGLAFDQVFNHASKFNDMYNDQVNVNLVIRTPMGGRRGYGPTHSQSLEKHFLGMPGLQVVALNSFIEPSDVYKNLTTENAGPSLVIENKVMYAKPLTLPKVEGFEYLKSDEKFPAFLMKPLSQKVHCTLIGYGGMTEIMVLAAIELFEKYDIIVQVLAPTDISGFEAIHYKDILLNSEYILTVEEGVGYSGFSSEVLASIQETLGSAFAGVKRLYPEYSSIPASGALENKMLPDVQHIVDKCEGLVRHGK
ncbi:pyruvate dehydrogenase [Bdellovibrio sp. qaytius]|nr:pyruvate dehydrogenase [Bdellovibrio sp. qaytius]